MFFKKILLLLALFSTIIFADGVKLIEQNVTKYKDSNWSFYASGTTGSGFYFWKSTNDRYMFKYLHINTFLTSNIVSTCCGGLKGELTTQEIVKLKEIIAEIKKLKTSKHQITTMIHALYLRTFIERKEKDIKKYDIDFMKENRENIMVEFYDFFNTLKGKKSTPCPSWGSTIPIRDSKSKNVQCNSSDTLPFFEKK